MYDLRCWGVGVFVSVCIYACVSVFSRICTSQPFTSPILQHPSCIGKYTSHNAHALLPPHHAHTYTIMHTPCTCPTYLHRRAVVERARNMVESEMSISLLALCSKLTGMGNAFVVCMYVFVCVAVCSHICACFIMCMSFSPLASCTRLFCTHQHIHTLSPSITPLSQLHNMYTSPLCYTSHLYNTHPICITHIPFV